MKKESLNNVVIIDGSFGGLYATVAFGHVSLRAVVAHIFKLKFSGYLTWLLWVVIHLLYLLGFENRVLIATQWAFNYFTKYRGQD